MDENENDGFFENWDDDLLVVDGEITDIKEKMEYNFRIYYSKESSLPTVEIMDDETVILMKASKLECNVPVFGLHSPSDEQPIWALAGKADSIVQENHKITID